MKTDEKVRTEKATLQKKRAWAWTSLCPALGRRIDQQQFY